MRVLSVNHGPSVPGGVFDDVVETAGHALDRWVVPVGGTPQPATAYDAVMVFGGSMHPDQDEHFGWLEQEAEFLLAALENDVPLIGVCLGAQMIARAAGAAVRPAREPEIGWHDVTLTPDGEADSVLGALPERTSAFQWHHYTFDVPDGGVELATSPVCTQAFRLGRAWGLQFHAEVTLPMVRAWVAEDFDELPMTSHELLEDTERKIALWNTQGRALCSAFLETAARG